MASESKTLTTDNVKEVAEWCGGRPVVEHDALDNDKTSPGINVPVCQNVERASLGDMVIRNEDGSFRVFKFF